MTARFLVSVAAIAILWAVSCESFVVAGLPTNSKPKTTIRLADPKTTIRLADPNNSQSTETTTTATTKTEEEKENDDAVEMKTWNPLRLLVLKVGMTEPVYSSRLNGEKRDGTYSCAFCGNILFDSSSKYDSRSGWPSFWRSEREGAINYKREFDGRLECRCGKCKSHLGHTFPDGPLISEYKKSQVSAIPESDPKTAQRLPRFCVNGASLTFEARE